MAILFSMITTTNISAQENLEFNAKLDKKLNADDYRTSFMVWKCRLQEMGKIHATIAKKDH